MTDGDGATTRSRSASSSSRFDSIVDEMTVTLEHAAWTSILALCRDFSCAIYDADARGRSACTTRCRSTPPRCTSCCGRSRAAFEGEIARRRRLRLQRPVPRQHARRRPRHRRPVFVDGEHLFWAVTKGHQLDIGAFVPPASTAAAQNVWQEGIQIPPLKLVDAGVPRRGRDRPVPREHALPGAAPGRPARAARRRSRRAAARLVELAEEYGAAEVARYVERDHRLRRPPHVGRDRGDAGRRVHRRGLGRQRRRRRDRHARSRCASRSTATASRSTSRAARRRPAAA